METSGLIYGSAFWVKGTFYGFTRQVLVPFSSWGKTMVVLRLIPSCELLSGFSCMFYICKMKK